MKRNYECLLIFDPGLTEELVEKEVAGFREMLPSVELATRHIGLKELSYPIRKKTRGYYLLCTFSAESELKKGLEDSLRLNPSVLRHLVIRMEKPAPALESETGRAEIAPPEIGPVIDAA